MSEWQPIETAPTDGKAFLGCIDGCVMYVCWRSANKKRWDVFDTGEGQAYSVFPTHWMPLPEPPAADEAAA